MAHFFINRPIFAWVIAIVIMLGGGLALQTLPIEQYPDIAPPQVSISATYTGASAETVDSSVSQVIEQQLKGIDNLLYMSSTSDAAGSSRTTLTFLPGTNVDLAQMQVQNKLQQAMSRLPPAVQSRGVTVTKGGNDYMIVYHFTSSDPDVSAVDVGDFLTSNLVDVIGRVDGVGEVQVFGTNYAMRIWMDPAKLEKYALMPSDIASAIQAQNTQVSAGKLGDLPALPDQQLNATITARSKLQTVEQFENVLLKSAPDGSVVLLKDVARVELGSDNANAASLRNGMPGAGMGIILADGANAMAVADAVHAKVKELAPYLPPGLTPFVTRDSSPFVRASINEVVKTLLEAMLLVFLVMYLFLQNFRATLIPAIAVPVVLLGTFGVLSLAGYSINMLTMFAMVLAIGLLVDDAIVVVENVERVMSEEGLPPKEAARKSMREITPALIGIGVTLSAVFIPMAFFGGSTGVIYRQFSVTIVAAMALSVFVALTLTPALCATMLKAVPKGQHGAHGGAPRTGLLGLNDRFFQWFNHHFDRSSRRYQSGVGGWLRRSKRVALVYLLLCGVTAVLFLRLPTSFLPNEDQGFVQIQINLPAGASDARLRGVIKEITAYMAEQPDVVSFNAVIGRGGDQSSARGFIRLKDWSERPNPEQHAQEIARKATRDLAKIRDARIIVSLPPAVRGLGSTAGFNFQLKDLNGLGHEALTQAKDTLLAKARERDDVMINVRSTNLDDTAQLGVLIDDRKAATLGLSTSDVNAVLSSALGGTYLNDFLHNGRVKRVYM
nr:efflux RND transporter permease subunit [Aquabacterium sp.]